MELLKLGTARIYHGRFAMKSNYLGCPLKRAKPDHDAAVFLDVCDGLDSASGQIQVRYLALADASECVTAFWRTIDVRVS